MTESVLTDHHLEWNTFSRSDFMGKSAQKIACFNIPSVFKTVFWLMLFMYQSQLMNVWKAMQANDMYAHYVAGKHIIQNYIQTSVINLARIIEKSVVRTMERQMH